MNCFLKFMTIRKNSTTTNHSIMKNLPSFFLTIALALIYIFGPTVNISAQTLNDNGSTHTINANGSSQEFGSAQDYIIPSSTSYNSISFTLRGGDGGYAEAGTSGGDPCKSNGGAGATTEAVFWIGNGANELHPGGTIRFIVGKHGEDKAVGGSNNTTGGGGGGTAVLYRASASDDWTILAVAGGGGGAHQGNAFFSCIDSQLGQGGRSSESGGDGEGNNSGSGGTNGNGGTAGPVFENHGDGGGGAYSDGVGAGPNGGVGGEAGLPGGGGGGVGTEGTGGYGFGGGGGSGYYGGGGGGGYSGGGGGGTPDNGGGGGSYANSTYDISSTKTAGANGGGNSVNGHVDYTFESATITWTGAVSHDWHLSGNWSPAKVPGSNDIVDINAAANAPYIWHYAPANARFVRVLSGGELTLQPNATLNLHPYNSNGISNYGTITNDNGTINISPVGGSNDDGILNAGGSFLNTFGAVINIYGMGRYGIWNKSNGTFTNQNGGTINIGTASSQIGDDGILNGSGCSFSNSGLLYIRNTNAQGINNSGSFTNYTNGVIKISQIFGDGIQCNGGTFTNNGEIRLGEFGNIGIDGVRTIASATFRNNASGVLSIWQSAEYGIFVQSNSTFENFGDMFLGGLGGSGIQGDVGIVVNGSMYNKVGGDIFIDQIALVGILNGSVEYQAVFNNEGNLTIGSVATTGNDGIQNHGTFNNFSTATINIVRAGRNGIFNVNGSFTNSGQLKIGENGSITDDAIRNGSGGAGPVFSNSTCSAVIHLFEKGIIDPSNSFTNSGTILQESTDGSNIETNNGTILYNAGTFTADNGNAPVSFPGSFLNKKIWTGCADSDWATAENWAPSGVPTATDDVIIYPVTNDPLVAAATAGLGKSLDLKDGATLTNHGSLTLAGNFLVGSGATAQGNGEYSLSGNFLVDNGGTFLPGTSLVTLDVIGNRMIGNSPLSFYDLVIDKPSNNQVTINTDVTVTNSLNLNSGNLIIPSGRSLTSTFLLPFNPNSGTSITNNGTLTVTGLGFGIAPNVSVQGDGHYIFSGASSSFSLVGGTFNPGTSTVTFSGTGTQSISSDPMNFYNLVIDKPSGEFRLLTAITVSNELAMVSGKFNLYGKDLELTGNGSISGEGPASYIYSTFPPFGTYAGVVKKTVDLNAPAAVNPGNIGATITSSANLGSTTIHRGHVAQNVNGEMSILRYYDISPANNSGLDATVRFSYLDHELNGIVEADMTPFRFNGSDWSYYAASAKNATANWVETENVDAFSKWTLATSCNLTTYYADADGDDYGDPAVSVMDCAAPAGYVEDNTDCDDSNGASFPGNAEICDGIDNNCDGTVDEGLSGLTYVGSVTFSDQSEIDAWLGCYTSITGNLLFYNSSSITDLSPLTNLTSVGGSLQVLNCDALPNLDGLENINSVGGEITISNNDNLVQVDALNGLSSVVGDLNFYNNSNLANLDGLVNITSIGGEVNISSNPQLTDLDGLSNVTSVANRLDVTNNAGLSDCCGIHYLLETPGAVGNVIYINNNNTGCDSQAEVVTYCVDADNDGFSMNDGDCDDGNADVNPDIIEICNGIDDNCDGQIDEGFAPCSCITTLDCDIPTTANFSGSGTWNSGTCNLPTPGREIIYSYTPTISGVHTLQVNSGSGNYVDYSYKMAANGCSETGWTCISPIAGGPTTNTFGPLTAGVEYYIKLDAGSTSSMSHNFQIICPPPPPVNDHCDEAITLPAVTASYCGTTIGADADLPNGGADCDAANSAQGQGVWYTFQGDGQTWDLFFPHVQGVWDPQVNVYSGSCGTYSCVTGDDYQGGGAHVMVPTVSGTTYYVYVHPACNSEDGCSITADFCFDVTLLGFPCYLDNDGDGYGDAANSQLFPGGCGTNYVSDNTDCDDNDADEFPGQAWYSDFDNDGYFGGSVLISCERPDGYKLAGELINTTQIDCDDNDLAVFMLQTWYEDLDGDNYTTGIIASSCSRPNGFKLAGELVNTTDIDCNDTDASINPSVTETCNGLDDNCDGQTDEGVQSTFYADSDGDGYGDPAVFVMACSAPDGYLADNTDCDDSDAAEFPGQTWYPDGDDDGYPGIATLIACERPNGYKTADDLINTTDIDCDDTNENIKPDATETCNGIDDNCDGQTDEGLQSTFYADSDGDGYGDPAVFVMACSAPDGYLADNTDCDDSDAAEFPGQTWYVDGDNDGYSGMATLIACERPDGYKTADELINTTDIDCNDNDNEMYPGAEEICDNKDNDCNDAIDDVTNSELANWHTADIGGSNGSASYPPCFQESDDVFTINASGFSTSSSDKLYAVYQELCGNGEIVARVQNVSGGGWAGIMLRESLSPGSRKVALKMQGNNNIRREIRMTTNGAVNSLNYFRPQHTWLRLVRNGNNFIGYTAIDGINWSYAFSATINMNGCIYAGLFSESINTNVITTATFDNVTFTKPDQTLSVAGVLPVSSNNGLHPAWDVDVFPNPTEGRLSLRFEEFSGQQVNIYVYNALGEQVFSKRTATMTEATENIDLSTLADGVYTVRVDVGQNTVTKRIVLTKTSGLRP